MKTDLGGGWDFWKDVESPIDVVRERLGIPPLRFASAGTIQPCE
jgi:hypothetical protein